MSGALERAQVHDRATSGPHFSAAGMFARLGLFTPSDRGRAQHDRGGTVALRQVGAGRYACGMMNTSSFAMVACAASLALACAGEARATTSPIVNPGFESTKPGVNGNPEGWATFQHAGPVSFDFSLDSGEKKSGTQSLRIKRIGPEVYGSATQVVPAGAMAGKTVRLSAWVRTEAERPADGKGGEAPKSRGPGAGLMLIAVRGSSILESDLMNKRQIRGTTPWTRYSIELAIPARATGVEIGAMLQGTGTVWIDDFELEVVKQ